MIIFKYQAFSVDDCVKIINSMKFEGEFKEQNEEIADDSEFDIVFANEHFLAVFNKRDNMMEMYGTKNTNSINYYIKRFGIVYDSYQVIKTKRWRD